MTEETRQTDLLLVKSLDALILTVSENTRTAAKVSESVNEVSESVKELSKCVTGLIQTEKVRVEKDKGQEAR